MFVFNIVRHDGGREVRDGNHYEVRNVTDGKELKIYNFEGESAGEFYRYVGPTQECKEIFVTGDSGQTVDIIR